VREVVYINTTLIPHSSPEQYIITRPSPPPPYNYRIVSTAEADLIRVWRPQPTQRCVTCILCSCPNRYFFFIIRPSDNGRDTSVTRLLLLLLRFTRRTLFILTSWAVIGKRRTDFRY
jgi:hypothetical protein